MVVTEIADVTRPSFTGGKIFYSNGTFVLFANETIKTEMSSVYIQQGLCIFANISNVTTESFILSGAQIIERDGIAITLQLTEKQRVAAIAFSGTPGGDGSAVELDIAENFARDISYNPCNSYFGLLLE